MRVLSKPTLILSLATLFSGVMLTKSAATGDQPSQLRFKAAPRSLPPVNNESMVRHASTELPALGDDPLQRAFDSYVAGLPTETAVQPAAQPLNRPMVDHLVRPVDSTSLPSKRRTSQSRRALHLQHQQHPGAAAPVAPPHAGAANRLAESYAVTAEKAQGQSGQDGMVLKRKARDCSSGCDSCYNNCRRFWLEADYLLWWTKGSDLPPLVTTSPQGTPRAQAGILPNAGVLFGNDSVNDGERSGYRLKLGYWLDRCCRVGIEGEFLDLGDETSGFDATSAGDPILARPFFNVMTGMNDAELVAYPGIVVGRIQVNSSSDLYSGGIRLRKNICCRNWCNPQCGGGSCGGGTCCQKKSVSGGLRVDWVAGYRYMRLDDNLGVRESLVSIDPSGVLAQGTMLDVFDDFQTDNEFHGGELGLVTDYHCGRWGLRALAKVALGNNREVVRINGGTVVTVPGVSSVTHVGGLLAQSTNIGTFSQDEFAVLPEASLSLYYQVNCNVRATVGYSFLYLSHVLRPGDQVDLGLNPSQFPPGTLSGAARPAFAFHDTDFWAQGLNLGLEVRH